MHIGLIIYGSLDILTGGFLYDKYLVQHLERQGHEVEILLLPWRRYGACLFQNFSKELRKRLLQTPFDLILQDELTHPSLFLLNRILHKRARFPIVTIVHQVLCSQPRAGWINGLYRAIESRYLQSVDACIFNSQTTRAAVNHLFDLKQPSLIACPGGDRLGYLRSRDVISSRAHQDGPLRLLFLGNILPNKGLYELIEVLSQIPKEEWHLTVVGSVSMDQEYVQTVQQLIRRKNISQQIVLTGPLLGEQIVTHFVDKHILTMPFSHEGFGMAYLEGMAYGLPAFGSSEGAVKEIVHHGINGFLVAPHDSNSFIRHFEHLYHDRNLLANIGIAALKTFHTHPTWAESMETIHQFLKSLEFRL